MIRVLIVEDQAILRESLARSVSDQPDMTVVAAIADASENTIQTASWRRHASRSSCPSVASLS